MKTIDDGALPLPVSIEEIDAAWLSRALATQFPGTVVRSARVDDVLWGTGTKVRVQLEYNEQGRAAGLPPSVIVKGGFSEHRQVMERCYELEVRFYRDLLPQIGLNAPRALFAASDPARQQHLVIMEDMNLRNVRFCRVQDPLSYTQAAAHLDVLARLHAKWWDSAALAPGGALDYLTLWDPLPDGERGTYQWGQLAAPMWDSLMALPRAAAIPRAMRDRDQMERALLKLKAFDTVGPMCFLHGDYHLGNLYFDADGAIGTLDWQSFCRGPWSHDVTYFMVSALDIADRRKWDKALMAYYLERLQAHGVARPPSFDDAMHAFRVQIIDGLYFWLVNPVALQAEVNNCAVAPRFAIAALDYDTFGIMG